MMMMMTINGYLLNLEINVVLEMVADTGQDVTECRARNCDSLVANATKN